MIIVSGMWLLYVLFLWSFLKGKNDNYEADKFH